MIGDRILLGLDPGLANCGYATVIVHPDGRDGVLELGVWRTEAGAAPRSSADRLRRAGDLARQLATFPRAPMAICAESLAGTAHASMALLMGFAWGVIAAYADARNIPIVTAAPAQIKKALGGAANAPKGAIEAAMRRRYGEGLMRLVADVKPADREHAFDALAAVVTCGHRAIGRIPRVVAA